MPLSPPRRLAPIVVLTAFAVLVGVTPASAAPTGSADLVAPGEARAGDSFDVVITLSGLDDVYAFAADVTLDEGLELVSGSTASPAGVYDVVEERDSGLTVSATRRGSSPALTGEVEVRFQATAVAPGPAAISLDDLTLVGAAGDVIETADASSATVRVLAAAVPPGPDPAPEPSASAVPAPIPAPDGTTPAAETPDSSSAHGADGLARTGSGLLAALVAGLAAIVAGVLAVVFRRRRRIGAEQ